MIDIEIKPNNDWKLSLALLLICIGLVVWGGKVGISLLQSILQ
jgi:hypothetical protein